MISLIMGKNGFVLPFLDQVFLLASAMLLNNRSFDYNSGHINYYSLSFWDLMHCKIRHMCVFIYICICFGVFYSQNTSQLMIVKSWSSMLQQQSTICPTTKWRILQFRRSSYTLLKVRTFKRVLFVQLFENRNILTQQKDT